MKTFMQIGLATSEEIQSWAERSFFIHGTQIKIGEVKKADTINYRSFKPEKDGLFCERIFGPVKDWVCGCGQSRLKNLKNETPDNGVRSRIAPFGFSTVEYGGGGRADLKGTPQTFGPSDSQGLFICPNCQVEVTLSRVRRYRMGYIQLGCPVSHIWYLNSRPNIFSVLLKIPTKYVKKITYYRGYSPAASIDTLPHLNTFSSEAAGSPGVLGSENPCIAPGGDFFDNEWEFLHLWFQCPRSTAKYSNSTNSGYLPNDKNSFQISTKFHLEGNESLEEANPSSFNLRKQVPVKTQKPIRLVSSLPSWLENTGAKAFKQHFETRNWKKEFEKLHEDLRRTPIFFSETLGNTRVETTKAAFDSAGVPPSPFLKGASHQFFIYDNLLKRRKKRVRTLKLLNILRTAGGTNPFDGFIFNVLPVLPPELRPIVQLSAGQFASSDVNDLYRRIISRNNRLKYYFTACGPHLVEFLVRSEQHLVQGAVDALFDGSSAGGLAGRSGSVQGSRNPAQGSSPSTYKSLSDRIGGKQGRFRQNLLGKRVDYSGRSVIVVGPRLKLHECGLPYEMALELFQAFILRHILELQLAKTIRGAKNLIKLNKPFARQILQNIIEAHPILLNRAPTLHRLGIQAFQPKLIFGRAIQLHPLVCAAFNADFDGDQMAVHVPLSPKSRVEARLLMLATTNWLSAATGQPSILPSQDMVLGFYYLTTLQKRGVSSAECGHQGPKTNVLNSVSTLTHILEHGPSQRNDLHIHEPLWVSTQNLWPKEHSYFVGGRLFSTESAESGGFLQTPGTVPAIKSLTLSSSKKTKSFLKNWSGLEGGKGSSYEPLVLRIFHSGFANHVYHSYKWTQSCTEERSNRSIRTTAGRVLVNEIFQKLASIQSF